MTDPRRIIETAAAQAWPRPPKPDTQAAPGAESTANAPWSIVIPEVAEDPHAPNAPYPLTIAERNWVRLFETLENGGYRLRPRYRPGWVGSWVGTKKDPDRSEDSIRVGSVPTIMDAVRTSDGAQVLLKMWNNDSRDGPEISILRYFSDPSRVADPRNHCVPLLDSFAIGGTEEFFKKIMVESLLRDWRYPPFVMVAEALSFIRQTLEGLEFMHEHRVSHGDIHSGNIMMDPKDLFPNGFHGAFNWSYRAREMEKGVRRRTRLQVPIKYYYIDFGSSVQFAQPRNKYLVVPGWTAWQSLEMARGQDNPYDPFKADVYCLGLTLLTEINKRTGLEFVIPTLIGMISENPDDRPTIKELNMSFQAMLAGLTPRQMRKRIGWPDDGVPLGHIGDWAEYVRVLGHSYWYGLPKDILPEKRDSWWKRFKFH
ncbi:kinase-like protein [Calocera viscosa TUFC12733]|uniref:Kinase-like protein n=1 Tax=Calocera viscosa (strain TUFC12733) TaxID=1330018 RepID=A0A167KVQ3_CALVF|nr:kinase-like protein [Calocera viscosa TUFC12733]